MSKGKSKKNTKTKRRSSSLTKQQLTNMIMGLFANDPNKTFNYKQISKQLDIKDPATRGMVTVVLYELRDYGNLVEVSRGKFKLVQQGGYVTGTVELTMRGAGYIISDESEEDIFVTQSNLNHALNGDTVKVYLYAKKRGRQPEGEVVEILHRAKENIVGVIEISKNFAFVAANTKQMPYDVFIPLTKINGAKNGDKVVVRITEWPEKYRNPFGEVVNVLGKPGENETEMHAILAEFDLPYSFDKKVEGAANKIPDEITEKDYKERRDFREIPTFTIDPTDAKDFDDALSLLSFFYGSKLMHCLYKS